MKTQKKIYFTLLLSFLLVPMWLTVKQETLTIRSLSDSFFMLSLVFLIIGLSILVLSSGFFDLFQKNMKRLIILRRKNEPKDYIPLSNIFNKKPIYWLVTGTVLLLLSLVLAIMS